MHEALMTTPADDWTAKLVGLAICCFCLLPFWLILLSDIADGFISPIMGLLSQSIPYLSPRLAGVTFLAIGNGAPDLSSNSNAIANGAVHLSAGALTGAAMFVQCIVASEVIRLSEGVPISPSQIRDMAIYICGIAMVLFFFVLEQFTFTFVALAIAIYSAFVLNVALGGFSVAYIFPFLFDQKRFASGSEEQAGLLEDGNEVEEERVSRGDTVRFNWALYRDQILQLQKENQEEEEEEKEEQEDMEVAIHPSLVNLPEEEEEGGASFAPFSEEPDWGPSPPPGRRKPLSKSFIHPALTPLLIPPSPHPSGLPTATPATLRRIMTLGRRTPTAAAATGSAAKVLTQSKLINSRAYKLAVLADHVSADPFHLENTVAPLTNIQQAEYGSQVLDLHPRHFLRNFSRIDTIGRQRDLSYSRFGSMTRCGSMIRSRDSSPQQSFLSRSRSMASSLTRSKSSRYNRQLFFLPSSSMRSPSRDVSNIASRFSRTLDEAPMTSSRPEDDPQTNTSATDHSPLPPPLSVPAEDPIECLSRGNDVEAKASLFSPLSGCWGQGLELLDTVLFEVSAGASEEWSDGSDLVRLIRMCFLPLLLPCYLLLRVTLPLLDPYSYRPRWLLLSITGAPVAAYLFLVSRQPADDDNTYELNLLITFALGLFLSVLSALTITRNKTAIPTLLIAGVDLAPSVFSLAAFFVGLLFVNLVAGEVVGILSLLAEVLKIPPSIVGMTLLAWGNSLSDLAGNTALAVNGLSSMALTACTAGPLFNMLVSMALGFLQLLADGKTLDESATRGDVTEEPGVVRVKISADIVVACLFLMGLNLVQILTVVLRSKRSPNGAALPKNFYLFSRAWYILYLVMAVSAAIFL